MYMSVTSCFLIFWLNCTFTNYENSNTYTTCISSKIINNYYWMRLSKIYCNLSVVSRSITLLDTEYLREAKRSAIFTQQQLQEGEKLGFIYTWAEYYLQPNKDGWYCAWADHYLKALICRLWWAFGRLKTGIICNELLLLIYCYHIYFVGVLVQQ